MTEKEEKNLEELRELAKPIMMAIFYDGYIRGLQDFAKALSMTAEEVGNSSLPVDLIVNELIPSHVKCASKKRDEILKEIDDKRCCLPDNIVLN